MKNENKCFFSISLENGITITGNTPTEVEEFLKNTLSAYHRLWKYYIDLGLENLEKETAKTIIHIFNAINTINNQLN